VSLKTFSANRMAFRQWHAQGPLVTAMLDLWEREGG